MKPDGPSSAGSGREPSTPEPTGVVALGPGDWSAWRWAMLRGAGFPASDVLHLCAPSLATAADELLELQARNPGTPAAVAAAEAFPARYAAARQQLNTELCRIAREPRFREAVTWQNRRALRNSVDGLLRAQDQEKKPKPSRIAWREQAVASYFQRYTVKNDTIGFFGPVGWARLEGEGSLAVRGQGAGLASRSVYFEVWCIDEVAEALDPDGRFRPWLPPRRLPVVALEGNTLFLPFAGPEEIPADTARLLAACDGETRACDVATRLVEDPATGYSAVDEVYERLEALCERGLTKWKLEVPLELHPERTLRVLLEGVDDAALRDPALAALDELEKCRDSVAQAAGDPDALDRALLELEQTFTRITEQAANRAAGQMYAARTLVYEDCLRGDEVTFGAQLGAQLGPPLSLVLDSARWFTCEMAARYRSEFTRIYREIVADTGTQIVSLPQFWAMAQSVLSGRAAARSGAQSIVSEVMTELQRRWTVVFGNPDLSERIIELDAGVLREEVKELFDAPGSGWSPYHSPDVMIAAESLDAVRRGEYRFVLGELHLSSNTLNPSVAVSQHPRPDELVALREQDLELPYVYPVVPKSMLTQRSNPTLRARKDYRVQIAPDPASKPLDRVLPAGEMVVEERESGLVVRTRDGSVSFDIVGFFGASLTDACGTFFRLLPPVPHGPRIVVDRLILRRESWRFAPSELPWITRKKPHERFVAARRWAMAHGIPRWSFYKVPNETKPVYLDLDSPVFVEILAKLARRTGESGDEDTFIDFSEMLPTHEQLWLTDGDDRRYTSELRIVVADRRPIVGPGTAERDADEHHQR